MKNENEIEKAKRLIEEENQKKIALFISEYNELCKKHGLQIIPQTSLIVQPIQNQN